MFYPRKWVEPQLLYAQVAVRLELMAIDIRSTERENKIDQ